MSKGYAELGIWGGVWDGERQTDRRKLTGERARPQPGGRHRLSRTRDSMGTVTTKASSSPTNPMPDLSLMPQLPRLGAGR